MNRNFQTALETVKVEFFKPNSPTAPAQSIDVQSVLLPVPFATGDVALAAMVKGLQEFYLKPLGNYGQTIQLDPLLLESMEEILKQFWKDAEASPVEKVPNLVL